MKKIKEIKGFESVSDIYYVTKDGRVLSIRNGETKELKVKLSRISKKSKGGYRTVCLSTSIPSDTVKKRYKNPKKNIYPKISRLVALAFIPNDDITKTQVDHIDKNKLNDNVDNLRWVTPKENSRHSNSKKVYCYDENGLVKIYECAKDTEKDGYNSGHVCAVARDKENHHKNKVFSYKEIKISDVVQRLSKPARKS